MTDISTPFPMIELGPGSTLEVDTGDPLAIVTGLVVYGQYYGPAGAPDPTLPPLFVPVPLEATE
jgi:hypothetical protein